MRRIALPAALLALVACQPFVTPTVDNQVGTKTRPVLATLSNTGQIANDGLYNSTAPALTTDGRYVLFRSGAPRLVTPNTTGYQFFLRDRSLETTELISRNDQGDFGNNTSGDTADLSNDGCVIAFQSFASNLVSDDTNTVSDVFVRNRCAATPTTKRISTLLDGTQTRAGNGKPDVSADGRYVVYENGDLGVCRYEVSTGTTVALTGTAKTGDHPSISDDGKRIAFYSYPPLVPGDTNGVWDIYLWNEGVLSLVSTTANGSQREQGDESISRVVAPFLSGDGRFVSFATTASNLVAGDTNGKQDVFVKNLTTGELRRVSVTSEGQEGTGDSPTEQGGRAALSRDGSWVIFETGARNLVGAAVTGSTPRTVMHNLLSGKTVVLDPMGTSTSGNRPALSNDDFGRFAALFSGNSLDSRYDSSGIFLFDRHELPVAVVALGKVTGFAITLDGTGSQNTANTEFFAGRAAPLTYTWSQTEGAAITLDDPHAATPTFTAPTVGKYGFKLVVSDGVESSAASTILLDVSMNKP